MPHPTDSPGHRFAYEEPDHSVSLNPYYQPWFDNHRSLRELAAELEALSLAIAEADPRWNR